ncbi:hypothetical protein P691DRAFT_809219 [Macrolepiota fuliginosa MF-IS2]|uniref:Uncharacterized protein n=1 Tax=Macrolepiota fuliginosa MF-IS2 TaxID=1400762 RepID=A0A9P5X4J6_9AGAR|nr:hypothetical protein P691DRAFT_809219 [Macrolepiota fuliginosa MF-IS2]
MCRRVGAGVQRNFIFLFQLGPRAILGDEYDLRIVIVPPPPHYNLLPSNVPEELDVP